MSSGKAFQVPSAAPGSSLRGVIRDGGVEAITRDAGTPLSTDQLDAFSIRPTPPTTVSSLT